MSAAVNYLRISTAGSVDDGKSTLIGRLFHDTRQLLDEQIVELSARAKKTATVTSLDLAALTDGLKAEREQGITIDVAYRHFVTPRRRFILADTPGHEQYTRNMATGASTADCAVILVDARNGVTTQTRRHAFIATLLGIRDLVVAVNKMDLVDWSEERFNEIQQQFAAYATGLPPAAIAYIPVSALLGDNVVTAAPALAWYTGPTLLRYLENLNPKTADSGTEPFRFPVQYVIRPDQNFRGLAGQVARGSIAVGDAVLVLPAGRIAHIRGIETCAGTAENATCGDAITIVLAEELDVSRGDVLVKADALPRTARDLVADLVWLNGNGLELGRRYLVKHGTRAVRGWISAVEQRTDIVTLERTPADTLALNEVGRVVMRLAQPLLFDTYSENRELGSFILIDPDSNDTVAAGMLRGELAVKETPESPVKYSSQGTTVGVPPWGMIPRVRRLLALTRRLLWEPAANDHAARERAALRELTALADEGIARRFIASLPEVRDLLISDVEAAMAGDPAARHAEEVILCYPSLIALTCQRLAHRLYLEGLPLVPRMMTEQAHSATGIDIHPGAILGSHCFIDHGTGVVIGETAVVGQRVRLYQGVTLGAKSFPLDADGRLVKGLARHPVIEDDVVIYAGATVLGRITVGRGSVIGGNVWVTRDLPPNSRIVQSNYRQESFHGHGEGI